VGWRRTARIDRRRSVTVIRARGALNDMPRRRRRVASRRAVVNFPVNFLSVI
jgi:hypothetical protein